MDFVELQQLREEAETARKIVEEQTKKISKYKIAMQDIKDSLGKKIFDELQNRVIEFDEFHWQRVEFDEKIFVLEISHKEGIGDSWLFFRFGKFCLKVRALRTFRERYIGTSFIPFWQTSDNTCEPFAIDVSVIQGVWEDVCKTFEDDFKNIFE